MGYGSTEYDMCLRHAAVRDGAWVGFRLAWEGLGALPNYQAMQRPRKRFQRWVDDPAHPGDPEYQHQGPWEWELWFLLAPGMRALEGTGFSDGRSVQDMLDDLHNYLVLPLLQIGDVDNVVYTAKFTFFEEYAITQRSNRWPEGAYLVHLGMLEGTLTGP
jgi:hypothetical protein